MHMTAPWRSTRQPIAYRPMSKEAPLDSRFPRAVAGEDYDRYSRAIWPQALRWVRRHWHRVMDDDVTMHDALDILRSAAMIDLSRRMYPQEEQLLGALMQEFWHASARTTPVVPITPEIPTFLRQKIAITR
jgi:hypothetical protein